MEGEAKPNKYCPCEIMNRNWDAKQPFSIDIKNRKKLSEVFHFIRAKAPITEENILLTLESNPEDADEPTIEYILVNPNSVRYLEEVANDVFIPTTSEHVPIMLHAATSTTT